MLKDFAFIKTVNKTLRVKLTKYFDLAGEFLLQMAINSEHVLTRKSNHESR